VLELPTQSTKYVPVANPMPHSERGKIGTAKRWGPRRTVRLTDLDPVTAGIIRAILTARENAAARPAGQE
jgi:hypothetical protein